MNRIDFITEWYHKENERQTSLNDSLNIPIGILTVLFALFFYMFTGFSFDAETNSIVEISFIVFMVLALICWVLVVFFLFRSYNNLFKSYEYKGIPYPTVLNEQYEKLQQYIEENKNLLENGITVICYYPISDH